MKLIACEIENFGKFHRRTFRFTEGLSAFCQPNGWGKSTLAAFIKSMFYGLSDNRARALTANDRKKYAPWQGGAFGGWLQFEYREKIYRLERFFGKTPASDVAKLYDAQTKMPSADFGTDLSKLGETLFGVDKDSFERMLYFPQEGAEWEGLTTDVKGRLMNAFSAAADETAERALARLDEAERALVKRSPYKGKLDLITDSLSALEGEKARLYALREELSALRQQLSATEQETQTIQQALSQTETALSQAEGGTDPALYRWYVQERASAEAEYARLAPFFRGQDPSAVDISGLEKDLLRYEIVTARLTELDSQQTQQIQQTQPTAAAPSKGTQKSSVPFWILTVFFLLLGTVSLFVFKPLSAFFFAATFLFAFLALLRTAKSKKSLHQAPAPLIFEKTGGEESGYTALLQEKQALISRIDGALSAFAFPQPIGRREGIELIKTNLSAYRAAVNRLRSFQNGPLPQNTPTPTQSNPRDPASLKLTRAELQTKLKTLANQSNLLCSQITAAEGREEELSSSVAREASLLQEKARLESKLTAIRLARQCLKQAQENLLSRYLLPVVEGCGRYLNEVQSTLRVQLDAEGKTYAEADGAYRDVQAFSRGNRTLSSLCVRLALVDELYKRDAPFLLFDDPFVDLDDQTLTAVKSLLKSLSSRRQIVYFTCRKEMLP